MAVRCAQARDVKLPTLLSREQGCSREAQSAVKPAVRGGTTFESDPQSFSTCTRMHYCQCQERASAAEVMPKHTSKYYKSPEECNRWAAFADAEGLRRAEWDLWAKLRSQDSETAESVFRNLADKYQPSWREENTSFKKCSGMPYCRCQGEATLASFSHCSHMPYCQCKKKASAAEMVLVNSSKEYKSAEQCSRWAAFADAEGLRRAEWDLWAKLQSQDSQAAESVFSNLADKYQPEWRKATICFEKCSGMPYCQCQDRPTSPSFLHCTHMPYCQCQEKASVAISVSENSSKSYKSSEERSRWAAFSDAEGLRRAEWDLWAKLYSQDSEGAESVFTQLAEKHQPEWRLAAVCLGRCSGMPYCQCK